MEEENLSFNCPRGAMLDAWSEYDWENGVQIDQMEDRERLVVRTHNSVYEITIISGHSGEVLVRGGKIAEVGRDLKSKIRNQKSKIRTGRPKRLPNS